MGDFDDFGELYADLECREIGIVRAMDEERRDKNELEVEGTGYGNGTIKSCSSDSEDDLQIVLNEPPFQLITAGRDCPEDKGDDMAIVTKDDCCGKELKVAELGKSFDGLLRINRERGISTRRNSLKFCSPWSALPSWNPLFVRGHSDLLTLPCSLGNASYNLGFPMAFSNGYDFYLPRNRSIFDIDVESFECKPWLFNGVDITDYFNFGLDEEGWRTYCRQLVQFQQYKLQRFQSFKLNKPTGTMSSEIIRQGGDNEPKIVNHLHSDRKGIKMPKGRAILVEGGNGDRIPSMNARRLRKQDFDVVIHITTGLAVEDALDPIEDRTTHVVDNASKSEAISDFSNEFCKGLSPVFPCAPECEWSANPIVCSCPLLEKNSDEKIVNVNFHRDSPSREISSTKPAALVVDHYCGSSKSSELDGSFEASRDAVFLEKVPSPECNHLNSDSLFQETVLSDCYLSNETGSDTSKIDHTINRDDSPESLLDPNFSEATTLVRVSSSPLHEEKEGDKHQLSKGCSTIIREWDDEPNERGRSSQEGQILSRKKIKKIKGRGRAASFLAHLRGHDEGPSSVINRKKRYTAREFMARRKDCYVNRRSKYNNRIQDGIVNRSYLQSNSRNMPLYSRKGCYTSRRIDEHELRMEAHYSNTEGESRYRERGSNEFKGSYLDAYGESSSNEYRKRSLDDYRERALDEYFEIPCIFEEDRHSINKYGRVPCGAGALRRFRGLCNYEKNQLLDFEWSSRYADDLDNLRLYEGGLHHRIYKDTYAAGGRDRNDDVSHRNRVPTLFKPDKRYMSHNGYSHLQETFPSMRNTHLIVPNKTCHKVSSKTGFNINRYQSAEVRAAYPGNSAYSESRKGSLPLPSPQKCALFGAIRHQNGQAGNNSFSDEKVSGIHLHRSGGNEFNVRSRKNSDSSGCSDSFSDDFLKNRHELDASYYREAVGKHLNGWKVKSKGKCTSSGRRKQLDNDLAAFNKPRDSNADCSTSKMKIACNHLCPEKVEELEEGQLVEESDIHETAEIKFNSDGKTSALAAKLYSRHPGTKNKLVGGYDRSHLLETLAKMEKRRERFKDPILPKKGRESCSDMQADAAINDEVKQQRPSRKRRWCSGRALV